MTAAKAKDKATTQGVHIKQALHDVADDIKKHEAELAQLEELASFEAFLNTRFGFNLRLILVSKEQLQAAMERG